MSTLALPIRTVGIAGLIKETKSTAKSEPAIWINEKLGQIRQERLESYAISNNAERAYTELIEVRQEASREGWDGYDALPLNPSACNFARIFLYALPTTAPIPEVSANPDGEVSLDWIFGQRRALTVSIGPTGRCTFAWIIGQRTNRGTDWIEDEIPAEIINALGQVSEDTTAT